MQHSAILVNSEGFGKRIQKEMGKHGGSSVLLVDTQKEENRQNRLVKMWLHAGTSAIERAEYAREYEITNLEHIPKWEIFREKILQKIEGVQEIKEEDTPLKISAAHIEVKQGGVYIDGVAHRTETLVFVNRNTEKHAVALDNLYLFLLKQKTLPQRWLIQGSSHKCAEAASILSDLGCKVYLITEHPSILPNEETNLQARITALMESKGVSVFLNTSIVRHTVKNGKHSFVIKEKNFFDHNILSIDYQIIEKEYSLAKETVQNVCVVQMQNPYLNRGFAEASILALLLPSTQQISIAHYLFVPRFIYTNPPAASVGYTEAMAQEARLSVRTANPRFTSLFYSVSQTKVPTDYKLIIEKGADKASEDEKVIGLHLFGNSSCDVIKGFSIALYCGISPDELVKIIPIHPTSSEEVITG
ncbi:glutathione reductase (NADPH) [Nematocida sp. AWRm77]|nr:glutathione reductase (NADPH) [Nematocida sp. AWRm77]